jgi:hypothetical protein
MTPSISAAREVAVICVNISTDAIAQIKRRAERFSDLKITFAWFGSVRQPGFGLHGFHLVADFMEPMLKLRGLNLDPRLAALAYDVGLRRLLQLSHEDRVLEAALGTRDVDGFVFKHIRTG